MGNLDHTWVVVTRPRHQAEALIRMIEDQGGHGVSFPALEIRPPLDSSPLERAARDLEHYHIAVFISPNAAAYAAPALLKRGPLPSSLWIAAVGRGTGRALAAAGLPIHIVPTEQFNSEGLLATPPLQDVAGKRVVIFRGNGGRDTLRNELTARGARVEYVECYRRVCPDSDDAPLADLWDRNRLDVFVVTSNATLRNLCALVKPVRREQLLATPVVVVSQRAAAECRQLGWRAAVVVADEASDAGVIAALIQWHGARVRPPQPE